MPSTIIQPHHFRITMLAEVNGIKLYYEKSGSGCPMLLLHGNTQNHRIFSVVTEELNKTYTVYSIDSRDHGKSSRVKALHYTDMAEDIAQFIEKYVDDKVIIYGLSDGGILALMLAINRPELLKQIIISGASTCPQDSKAYALKLFKFARLFYPSKMKMLIEEPSISSEQLSTITVPTVVLAGSNDMIRDEATRAIAAAIPNSKLEILQGESHTSYAVRSKKLYPILKKYL